MRTLEWARVLWIGAGGLLIGGCAGAGSTVLGPTPPSSVSPVGSPPLAAPAVAKTVTAAQTPHSLADVRSWTEPPLTATAKPAVTLAALTEQPAALLIVDPAMVPAGGKNDKVKPLDAIRQSGKRKVLALLPVSEIDRSGPAWNAAWVDGTGKLTDAAPKWLEAANAKSPGIFPVQFWNADWQKQVSASLGRLVAAGYDGVCLQGVGDYGASVKAHPTAAQDMAAFVEDLADQARKKNAAFSVITEGGADLPGALVTAQTKLYYSAVDGILMHDVFYPGGKPTDNDLLPNSDLLADLDDFQQAGKAVFVTERLTDPDKIADFLTRAKSKGYIPDAALAGPPATPTPDPKVADARL